MNNIQNIQSGGRHERGFAAIELTVILPFLLLLIFATAEFGRMLYQYNALNKTVRNASRYLTENVDIDTGVQIVTTEVQANVENFIKYGALNSSTELLPNLTASTVTISLSGKFVTLNVSYPWQPLFADMFSSFGLGNDINVGFPLVSIYTMRIAL